MNRSEEEFLNSSLKRVLTLTQIYTDFEYGKSDNSSDEKSEQEALQTLFNAF